MIVTIHGSDLQIEYSPGETLASIRQRVVSLSDSTGPKNPPAEIWEIRDREGYEVDSSKLVMDVIARSPFTLSLPIGHGA